MLRPADRALFLALDARDDARVAAALAAGADPAAVCRDGMTVLEMAAVRGTPGILRRLLAAGADPCLRTARGVAPIRLALNHGRRDLAVELAEAGAARGLDETAGYAVLVREAIRANRVDLVRRLVDDFPGGFSDDWIREFHEQAAEFSTDERAEVMRLLTARFPGFRETGEAVETILARMGNAGALRVMLEHRFGLRDGRLAAPVPRLFRAVMREAARVGATAVVRLLLEVGVPVGGGEALTEASAGGHAACVRALLDAGADPNARTSAGRTPLHFAVSHGDGPTIRHLLDAGADLAALSKNQILPFDSIDPVRLAKVEWGEPEWTAWFHSTRRFEACLKYVQKNPTLADSIRAVFNLGML